MTIPPISHYRALKTATTGETSPAWMLQANIEPGRRAAIAALGVDGTVVNVGPDPYEDRVN